MPVVENSVLIVDDDPAFRILLKRRLEAAGFVTSEAGDGAEAIEVLKVETPDVVLLDINMPNTNGYEVLDWIKHNNSQSINVIILTGEDTREHIVGCMTRGAKDFLLKSAGRLELISRLRRLCEISNSDENTHYRITDTDPRTAPILIVDDQELSVDLTARRLANDGLTVYRAYSGSEALQILQDREIRLVLLDIDMPDINGYDLLSKIRQQYPADKLGIIMLTATDDPKAIINCMRMGADDYITKPFRHNELVTRIHISLHRKLHT